MLDQILKYKREELEHLKRKVRLGDVRKKAEDVERAMGFLEREAKRIQIIAEIKKASPSAGVIVEKYDPVGIALQYEENGATALSVLTDEHFFQGKLSDLTEVQAKVRLPVLRKDFTFDEYQIFEARGAGADAVLLIARILTDSQLKDYRQLAGELGMAGLVEIHDENELDRAVRSSANLIGINNRDLDTLKTDLAVTERLVPKVPEGVAIVSESGISSRRDIERLQKTGVNCFLVGESLLREKDPGGKLRELL